MLLVKCCLNFTKYETSTNILKMWQSNGDAAKILTAILDVLVPSLHRLHQLAERRVYLQELTDMWAWYEHVLSAVHMGSGRLNQKITGSELSAPGAL